MIRKRFSQEILISLLILEVFFAKGIYAQGALSSKNQLQIRMPEVSMDGHGVSVAVLQGRYTFLELGVEKYWQQVTFFNPRTTAVSLGMAYNPFKNIGGLSGNIWTRKGRLSFTYGASAAYYSDFSDIGKFSIGPTLGYRLLGFHFGGGYNFLLGDKTLEGVNTYQFFARYYIPLERDIKLK